MFITDSLVGSRFRGLSLSDTFFPMFELRIAEKATAPLHFRIPCILPLFDNVGLFTLHNLVIRRVEQVGLIEESGQVG